MKEAVHKFNTSSEAWEFMRQCEARGVVAGFPSLKGAPYTVRVLIKDGAKSPAQMDHDIDEALAKSRKR